MRSAILLALASWMFLGSSCGPGGDGFGCTGGVCTATFDGTGRLDLSSELGDSATIELRAIDRRSADVAVAGSPVILELSRPTTTERLTLTLTEIGDDRATIRVARATTR